MILEALAGRLKACVFDFDGTLVDTMQGFADLAAELLQKYYGMDFQEARRRYLDTSGIPFFQQLQIIRPGGFHNQTVANEFERRKLDGFFATAPNSETVAALHALRRQGYKTVVSSNNFQDNITAYMKRRQLPVDLALGFDSNGLEKGLRHFEEVRRRFGLEFTEMLFCGDSLKDGERALGCGVEFVGLTGTFTSQQFLERFPGVTTVKSVAELARRLGCRLQGRQRAQEEGER